MPRTMRTPEAEVQMSNLAWGLLMRLGYDAGWRPRGTIAPAGWDDEPALRDQPGSLQQGSGAWNGGDYFSPLGQQVSAEDASNLAGALESAMPDLPDHDAIAHKVESEIQFPNDASVRYFRPGESVNAYEYFSGPNKEKLRRLIDLLRTGPFTIH